VRISLYSSQQKGQLFHLLQKNALFGNFMFQKEAVTIFLVVFH